MKKIILIIVLALMPSASFAQEAYNPEGLWLTENQRSAIRVEKCDKGLCGRIAWIIDGGMQTDDKNPVEELRGQPICGLEILNGFTQAADDPNEWEGGHIYKADDGDIYNAEIKVLSADEMNVRGYVGISLFGKSQTWKRVSDKDYPKCKAAK
ncbi:MAG TPA: DUF2147 domain-containing protein [Alphaproteobacteria bacterium]|nr:DUF2147 domain-containing protein [Alphaproteobacteria bacterium]